MMQPRNRAVPEERARVLLSEPSMAPASRTGFSGRGAVTSSGTAANPSTPLSNLFRVGSLYQLGL